MDFVFFESIFCLISCFWSKNKNPFHHDQKRVIEKKKEKKKIRYSNLWVRVNVLFAVRATHFLKKKKCINNKKNYFAAFLYTILSLPNRVKGF